MTPERRDYAIKRVTRLQQKLTAINDGIERRRQ